MRILIFFFLFFLNKIFAAQIATTSYPQMEKYLKEENLNWNCNLENIKVWEKHIGELILQSNHESVDKNADKNKIQALELAFSLLQSIHQETWPNRKICESLEKAYLILYAVKSSEVPPATMSIFSYLSILNKINHSIRYLDESERTYPLLKKSQEEAINLVDPKNPKMFLTLKNKESMSSIRLSELEISDEHILWKNLDFKPTIDLWNRHENRIEKMVNQKLKNKNANYTFLEAQKVMIFDKLKSNATSPKITVKDLYGMKWKMKWGNETQTEPIANRLAILAGAKFADLTYSIPHGDKSTILILGDRNIQSSCENINTYEWLNYCLLTSIYKFGPNPYVYKKGFVTTENVESLLGQSKNVNKYIGREFVQFKEVQLEFSPENVFSNIGVLSQNNFLPFYDRVQRGLWVFNAWISHNDGKEDNTKILLNKENGKTEMVAYQSDLGSTLGDTFYPGSVNNFATEDHFMSVGRSLFPVSVLNAITPRIMGQKRVFLKMITPFRPGIWNYTTFADSRWMAQYIARISVSEIRKAVESSHWPNYIIDAMTQKLVLRRNHIAKIFGVENFLDTKEVKPLRISVDLSTPELRLKYAKAFDLNPEFIDSVLKKEGKLNSNYREWLVYDGKLQSCKDSVITYALEKSWHPAGISRRQNRAFVKKGLPECR